MKLLLDFLPIALFFIVYKLMGLYAAIYAMIAASVVQVLVARWRTGKFEKMQVITLALLVVFGGVTLAVRDPAFLMWKVSVLYVVFALALIGSLWIGNKPLLQRMLGKELDLPGVAWNQVTWLWGLGVVGIVCALWHNCTAVVVAQSNSVISNFLSNVVVANNSPLVVNANRTKYPFTIAIPTKPSPHNQVT
jgi:intracellular septation protein